MRSKVLSLIPRRPAQRASAAAQYPAALPPRRPPARIPVRRHSREELMLCYVMLCAAPLSRRARACRACVLRSSQRGGRRIGPPHTTPRGRPHAPAYLRRDRLAHPPLGNRHKVRARCCSHAGGAKGGWGAQLEARVGALCGSRRATLGPRLSWLWLSLHVPLHMPGSSSLGCGCRSRRYTCPAPAGTASC